ncbi:hypothetical protein LJC15_05820, partial [Desulfovibrio sp. OttesenSCG-928-G11]|nr:hypothetical protein [Desulfovibrio sp. OttesenSCG-928-G11]
KDGSGTDVPIPNDAYSLIPSAIEFARPWAEVRTLPTWPEQVQALSVTCTAGWGADSFPDGLRNWALVRLATLYDNRADLVTGTITASLPRHHTDGFLDRWLVMGSPYA